MENPNKLVNVEYGQTAKEGANLVSKGSMGEVVINKVLDETLNGQLNRIGMKETILERDMVKGQIEYIVNLENIGLSGVARYVKAYRPLEKGSNPAVDKALGALGIISNRLDKKVTVLDPVYAELENNFKDETITASQKEIIQRDMKEIEEEKHDLELSKNIIINYVNELFGFYDRKRESA